MFVVGNIYSWWARGKSSEDQRRHVVRMVGVSLIDCIIVSHPNLAVSLTEQMVLTLTLSRCLIVVSAFCLSARGCACLSPLCVLYCWDAFAFYLTLLSIELCLLLFFYIFRSLFGFFFLSSFWTHIQQANRKQENLACVIWVNISASSLHCDDALLIVWVLAIYLIEW